MEIQIDGLRELEEAVQILLDALGDRRLITFSGEIGAGKTTFIQAFCRRLGVREPVTSPTFSIINEYTYPDAAGRIRHLYHLDLYRLQRVEEALDLGIEEYLDGPDYCLIEWPEVIEPLLPEDAVRINLEIVRDSTRKMLLL